MTRIVLFALLSVCLTGPLHAGEDSSPEEKREKQDRPSAEMLAFLAEFEDVDDETFELLVEHGLRDHRKQRNQHENQSDDQNEQEAPHGEDG